MKKWYSKPLFLKKIKNENKCVDLYYGLWLTLKIHQIQIQSFKIPKIYPKIICNLKHPPRKSQAVPQILKRYP